MLQSQSSPLGFSLCLFKSTVDTVTFKEHIFESEIRGVSPGGFIFYTVSLGYISL